jgi:nitrate/nitrite-specific signal transduction histidine kinase
MRERAQKLGAQLDIWSREGAGTEIALRVPAAVAYIQRKSRSPWHSLRNLLGAQR